MLNIGSVLENRYEIIRVVGCGGMSTVYQARDKATNAILAVKDIKRTGNQNNQEMEERLAVSEANILKTLLHPSLPRIHEVLESQNGFILIMDFIEGESLDKVISREGKQPVERVLDWGMQICEVFHYLHNQPVPIIYRDMKPANVMRKPDGRLMMIDFGTARTLKANVQMSADTICIGTAGFAAPEQFGGIGQSTERTDIFCLGATLYNMVTGHSPSEKPVGILPLEHWDPALQNTPISEIIYKCTRNDPNERYANAMELYEDLRMAMEGTYFHKNTKGKSGPLSGKLLGWQKQEGGGLLTGKLLGSQSGALQKQADQGNSGELSGKIGKTGRTGNTGQWQKQVQTPIIPQNQASGIAEVHNAEDGGYSLTDKLTLICVTVAVVFLIAAVVLALLQVIIGSVVFLAVAIVATVAAFGMFYYSRNGKP